MTQVTQDNERVLEMIQGTKYTKYCQILRFVLTCLHKVVQWLWSGTVPSCSCPELPLFPFANITMVHMVKYEQHCGLNINNIVGCKDQAQAGP